MVTRVRTSTVSVITQKRRESFTQVEEDLPRQSISKTSVLDKTKKSLVKFVPSTDTDVTDLKRELEMDDHKIPIEEIYKIFKTDPENGVTEEWARTVQQRDGYNRLTPPKVTPFWIRLLKTMFAGFALLLWAGGILCFCAFFFDYNENEDYSMDNFYLGVILCSVVIMSSIFTYFQERKSEKIMESFQRLIPQNTTVIRDGQYKIVSVEELIVGDIVEVKIGDRIPADIRIIWANNFKVDNSALTGESVALSRTPEFTDDNPLETKNLIFFSTHAVEGSCRGVVTQCGDNTVMGRIAHLTTRVEPGLSPIAREIQNFVRVITIVAGAVGGTFLVVAILMGYTWLDALVFCIGIIVANVPEGLLPTVTVCLSITAKQMANKNCLVKHLEAVESLGSTSTICSDKTGTLTQNRMTVAHLWYDKKIITIDTGEDQKREDVVINRSSPTFNNLCQIAGLCNKAVFLPETLDQPILKRETRGDASESALLKFTELVYGDVKKLRKDYPEECLVPFSSVNKYQLSIHKMEGEHRILMKGAPEKILEFCSTVLIEGKAVPIDEEFKKAFKAVYENLGGKGERVLGFCDHPLAFTQYAFNYKFDSDKLNFPMKEFRFVGLIAMIDPPRSAVPDAVRKCRTAGIKVIMVTGDHPITGKAIAQMVGIITEEKIDTFLAEPHIPLDQVYQRIQAMHAENYDTKAIVLHGYHLRDITHDDLKVILSRHPEIVFARTSPQQKLLIVEGCQQLGAIVAVTGDGVNDSPALKKADIGVAMGISGSDVSKQAADMILLDDNFASIITGIEEGRRIFDNLKKAIAYVLTSNVPEICPFLFFIALRMPLTLNTINILFIDLGTDILPTVTLGYEFAEWEVMLRKPRDPRKDKLVPWGLIRRVILHGWVEVAACNFCFFVVAGQNGFLVDRLLGHRSEWINPAIDDFADSYGQEWNYDQRKELELYGNTASFVVIVEMQVISLITCKTIIVSVFTHGFRNMFLNLSVVFTVCLCCLLCYTPYVSSAVNFRPIKWQWWLTAIPFMFYLITMSETLKYLIRHYPNSVYDEFRM